MTDWTYSHKRLAQLDADLERIGLEMDTNLHAQHRTRADLDTYNDLGRQWARLTDERDRCAMALWRRNRGRTT